MRASTGHQKWVTLDVAYDLVVNPDGSQVCCAGMFSPWVPEAENWQDWYGTAAYRARAAR